MSQWTPGPWEVARRAYVTIEAPAHCGPIACMANRLDLPVSDSRVQATQEANACLIALAPEMAEYIRAFAPLGGCVYETQPGLGPKPIECRCGSCCARALLARLDA